MDDQGIILNWLNICIISALGFKAVNRCVVLAFPPPNKFRNELRKMWLWENICTSLVHSFSSSVLALVSLYRTPSMVNDMINSWNTLAYCTLSFSMGYFLYDFINLIINDRQKGLCVMIHHVLVIFIFYITVSNKKYIPFALSSLLMEINSVFLHTRRLMNMCDVNPKGVAFTVNRIILTITFVIFRLVTCGWMVNFIAINYLAVSSFHLACGVFGLCVVIPQNLMLLAQVWISDAKFTKRQLSGAEAEKDRDRNANYANGVGKLKQFLQMTVARSAE